MHLIAAFSSTLLTTVLMLSMAISENGWFHLQVHEGGQEQLALNVPVSVVSTVVPVLESHMGDFPRKKVRMGRSEWSVAEMRELWNALKSQGSGELANLQTPEQNLRIMLDEDHLMIDSQDASKEKVHVRVPVPVVDALLSGTGDELNLTAGLEALSALGSSDLLEVQTADAEIRVWID